MAEEEVRITLRLPISVRDQLLLAAETSSRSMNGEIVERLRWTLGTLSKEVEQLVHQVHERDEEIANLKAHLAVSDDEWKKRYEVEHEAYERLRGAFDVTKAISINYQEVMVGAHRRSESQLNAITALSEIIMSLDDAPTKQIKDFAATMKESSSSSHVDLARKLAAAANDHLEGKS